MTGMDASYQKLAIRAAIVCIVTLTTFSPILPAFGGESTMPLDAEGDNAEMVFIPGGEFWMGTAIKEAQRLARHIGANPAFFSLETPLRKVCLKPFLIDKYPVTNSEYKRFIDATKYEAPEGWTDREYPKGTDDHPVTNINWPDADTYAKWAGKRLPTAEEWEKAARGTDGRRYPWGDKWNPKAARIDNPKQWPRTRALTTPVGSFPEGASPYGVMDMCGNVAEWTTTAPSPSDPYYVVKGASAVHHIRENFRCAAVNFSGFAYRRHDWLGFRCAKDCTDQRYSKTNRFARPVKPLTPISPVDGPVAERYGKEPIRLSVSSSRLVEFEVPYFPASRFTIYFPEHVSWRGFTVALPEQVTWEVNDTRTVATYRISIPNTADLVFTVKAANDCVDYSISLRNLGRLPLLEVSSNVCMNNNKSGYFENMERDRTFVWTDSGPVSLMKWVGVSAPVEPLHGGWGVTSKSTGGAGCLKYPLMCVVSRDGKWVIAHAMPDAASAVASNAHYSCLHVLPQWRDIAPGEEQAVSGRLYYIKGGLRELLSRWKNDFRK